MCFINIHRHVPINQISISTITSIIHIFTTFRIVFNNSVGNVVGELCERLIGRSRLVLMRTSGVVRHATALVQHFTPACRVARMYPQYPISRLLMSLNDSDLPPQRNSNVHVAPYFFLTFGLLLIAYLPELLQDSVLTSITTMLIDLAAIGVYFLGRYITPVLSVTLMLLCFCGYVLFEYYRYLQQWAVRNTTENSIQREEARAAGRTKGASKFSYHSEKFFDIGDSLSVPSNEDDDNDEEGGTSSNGSARREPDTGSQITLSIKKPIANELLRPLQGLSERWLNKESLTEIAKQCSIGGVPVELVCALPEDSGSDSDIDKDREQHSNSSRGARKGGVFARIQPMSPASCFSLHGKTSEAKSDARSLNSFLGSAVVDGGDESSMLGESIASIRSIKPDYASEGDNEFMAIQRDLMRASYSMSGRLTSPSAGKRLGASARVHPGLKQEQGGVFLTPLKPPSTTAYSVASVISSEQSARHAQQSTHMQHSCSTHPMAGGLTNTAIPSELTLPVIPVDSGSDCGMCVITREELDDSGGGSGREAVELQAVPPFPDRSLRIPPSHDACLQLELLPIVSSLGGGVGIGDSSYYNPHSQKRLRYDWRNNPQQDLSNMNMSLGTWDESHIEDNGSLDGSICGSCSLTTLNTNLPVIVRNCSVFLHITCHKFNSIPLQINSSTNSTSSTSRIPLLVMVG